MRSAPLSILTCILAVLPVNPASADLNPLPDPDGDSAPGAILWDRPQTLNQCDSLRPGGPPFRGGAEYLTINHDPEGDMPREVAFLADGSAVVVVNRDTDNLMFFDVATRTVTHVVDVGDFPVHLAVSPDNRYVVVANVLSHDVSVIDVATRSLLANVPVAGLQPYRVAITPDSSRAVVGVINDAVISSFSIINLDGLVVENAFNSTPQGVIGFFFTPEPAISGNIFTQFALTPDGAKIILPDYGNARVALYTVPDGAQTLLAVPSGPLAVDVSLDGALAVIQHQTSPGAITTIDLAVPAVLNTFSTVDALSDQIIRITPDKSHAIAAISNNVIFTNLATGARAATINTGVVGDIELSFDGQYAFVSNFNARIIDVPARTLVKTISYAACAESAVSPTQYRAVALNNRFREDLHFYNINGAAGYFEGAALSGPAPEGDCPRSVTVSADGSLAITSNLVSRNISIIDMQARDVRSYVNVGDRAYETAITPDGAYAVALGADDNAVRIIDLAADAVVKSFTISTRPMRVKIAPDGSYAYVLNIAGGDKVSFIRLDGANSAIEAQLPSGETGSVGTYLSGVGLTHDGSIFAVCAGFDDRLNLFDTATKTQIASVPVGDFPLMVAFSPDDTRAYVSNVFSDNVSVVLIDGANSQLIANVGTLDYPVMLTTDAGGNYVYVANVGSNPGIRVLNAATNTFVKTLPYPSGYPAGMYLSWTDNTLYAASSESALFRYAAAGPASAFIDSTPLTASPTNLAFDNWLGVAVLAQPFPDGVDFVQFGCIWDLDADRDVDLSDLAQLLGNYGITAGAKRTDGDLDGDGDVDIADLAELLGHYGTSCS